MMLHEAVMLEIYRQALNASELASPRCQSRESNSSAVATDVRCPSNESHCSGNDGTTTPAATPIPTTPPVGLPLPATLAPAAAAALLPPQSAAMAAYLNAAAAAHQNHLLLTNPLAAAATLVQQATQSHSPCATRLSANPSPSDGVDVSALDFSTKRRRESEPDSDEEESDDVKHESNNEAGMDETMANDADVNSPLDLSVSSGRKRESPDEEAMLSMRKIARHSEYKALSPGTWVPPINPYLAAVAAASMSPKTPVSLDWTAKQKILPNEATKALEKMTEMTRLGSATDLELPARQGAAPPPHPSAATSNGRHSAWQSHWLNKGADAVKDVFKCVWCKQSFPTLASLTTHMKETQHCGVNVPPTAGAGSATVPTNSSSSSGGNHATQSAHHMRHSTSSAMQGAAANSAAMASAGTSSSSTNSSSKSDLNLLIKETMPLPRKLVRGQDVWLGKGAEQTRQILKCMWCGQSFRSLAEMTSHMQETQHYTNIISQEQIISWKSSDDKSVSSNGTATTSPAVTSPTNNAAAAPPAPSAPASSSTVSAVLTCKVCDQAFPTLKELSNHMAKNSHYKDHMMRPVGESNVAATPKRGRQTREKRKKSLPVRKLLEMERAQADYKSNSLDPALKPLRDFAASTKITCEKCGDKVETALFVDHIRQCLGGMLLGSPRHSNSHKTPYPTSLSAERLTSPHTPNSRSDGRKTADDSVSPLPATRSEILCPLPPKDGEKSSSTPSVLNAIEQLIEKSFDTKPRHSNSSSFGGSSSQRNTPLGSSILKRLGIDDNVDYTKPLMDPQTMHFLRSYSSYSGRDRSASESSSVSERCNSRIESFTPERNVEHSRQQTPCHTPERTLPPTGEVGLPAATKEPLDMIKIKSEPTESVDEAATYADNHTAGESTKKISVKKEFSMTDDHDATPMSDEPDYKRKSITPSSRAISPTASERSITPKSSTSSVDKKVPPAGSSLNALSSMFDNLNNMSTATSTLTSGNTTLPETNNNHSSGKKSNANPLAALQKLCETTEPQPASKTRSGAHLNARATPNGSVAGGLAAFNWACNDAGVMSAGNGGSDSLIKCSHCDTSFSSKGAYRHHYAKMHFAKDEMVDAPSPSVAKSPALAISPKSMASPKSSSKSPVIGQRQSSSPMVNMTPPVINPYNESPQSKFLKYTELAKQLSSKNA